MNPFPEVGIYKRKQETRFQPRKRPRKKERKHALDQEGDQEKKKKLTFFLTFLFSFINPHLWRSVLLDQHYGSKWSYGRLSILINH